MTLDAFTKDIYQTKAQRRREAKHWEKVRNAERNYAIQLRKIARHVGEIIRAFKIGDPAVVPEVQSVLRSYATIILPWAKATSARMLAEVNRRDQQAWHRTAQKLGRDLHKEVADAPIGDIVRQLQNEQVDLITSIPLDAAQRVQELTQEYVLGGRRYDDLVQMILNSTNVSLAKATLIARTETGKASASLVQARAEHIGSDSYIWHTVQDIYVRKAHRKLNGTIQKWDDPPIAEENGDRHHPGMFPNCRCFAEPVVPDTFTEE